MQLFLVQPSRKKKWRHNIGECKCVYGSSLHGFQSEARCLGCYWPCYSGHGGPTTPNFDSGLRRLRLSFIYGLLRVFEGHSVFIGRVELFWSASFEIPGSCQYFARRRRFLWIYTTMATAWPIQNEPCPGVDV
ncbi:uncharacterized protein YALI1_C29485g [Yarrowia lipolytica]|uniref:Uncharacterized protein n=1 Tax=Yarrowia lipolytica TaxID=4952 RepID=A0A1D8NC37_YARLL|nr:hypothetical protein YALI1_C29485g [Yarrowia lipolytica]